MYRSDINITDSFPAREFELKPQVTTEDVREALQVIKNSMSPGTDTVPIPWQRYRTDTLTPIPYL